MLLVLLLSNSSIIVLITVLLVIFLLLTSTTSVENTFASLVLQMFVALLQSYYALSRRVTVQKNNC